VDGEQRAAGHEPNTAPGSGKTKRAAPVLLIGFGLLIGLIALTGLGALHRAQETYRDISAINERFRRTQRALDNVGVGIQLIGLLTRDYLLDPSNVKAAQYRAQLVAERTSMESDFRDLQAAVEDENRAQVEQLRKEVDGAWDALDPLFEWTPEEKAARSWGFLRREVLPRREAALLITREISAFAQKNLERQRHEVDKRQKAMAGFIGRMLGITVLLGLIIAGVSVLRMTRLERRTEEQHLRTEAAERKLRQLSRQLVQAQEEERKSISRELHDETGQMLTALRMELRGLQELRTASEPEFNEHVEDAKHLAEQCLRSLKDMAMGLRPSMLDDLGLGSAVQWQARQFSKHTGIPVNVQLEGLPARLPEPHRICVYRLVQEALTNCARHSKARTIDISVAASSDVLSVCIRDDGVGFHPDRMRGRGIGLIGMQERVMELGGEVSIDSQPKRGTTLSAKIPLTEEAANRVGAYPACG
jgi:signal transduction histidine kinase